MPRVLKDIHITEVSGVDRGAGRGVKIVLMKRDDDQEPYWKRDFSQEQRDAAAESGAALPDGSFPIKTLQDLKNAIHAIGRAKDPAKVKAHIKTRARALGHSDLIPEDWTKRDDSEDIMTEAELKKAIDEAVKKAVDPISAELAKVQAENAILKMSAEHKAYHDALTGDEEKKNFAAMTPEQRDEKMKKSPMKKADDDPVIKKLNDENAALTKRLAVLEDERLAAQFEKRATDMGLKAEDGALIRKAYAGDAEAQTKLDEKIKSLTAAIKTLDETGTVFKEFGTQQGASGSTAADEMKAKAAEVRKADPKLSEAQAYDKAFNDPANADLRQRVRADEMRKSLTVVAA